MKKFCALKSSSNSLFLHLFSVSIFCAVVSLTSLAVNAQESILEYHGFKVNYEQIKDAPQKETILKAVERQIEIVEQVKLSKDFLDFFKTVPVIMIPDASGTPGIYGDRRKIVLLKGRDLAANKPILLHEYLHAYHDLKIPDGFQNHPLKKFYDEGKIAFPNFSGTYFLSNASEFFAVTASIYLFGDIPRPPFNRSNVKSALPDYYQYLENMFRETTAK